MSVQNVSTIQNATPQNRKQTTGQTIASGAFVGVATAASGYFFLPNRITGEQALTLPEDKFTKAIAKVSVEKHDSVEDLKDIRKYAKDGDIIIDTYLKDILKDASEISNDNFIKEYTGGEFLNEKDYNAFIEKTKTETTKLKENFNSAKSELEKQAKIQEETYSKINSIVEKNKPARLEDLNTSQAYASKSFAAYEKTMLPSIPLSNTKTDEIAQKLSKEILEPEIKFNAAADALRKNQNALTKHEIIGKIFASSKENKISKDSLKKCFTDANLDYLKSEANEIINQLGKDAPKMKSIKKAAIVGVITGAVYTGIMALFSGNKKQKA